MKRIALVLIPLVLFAAAGCTSRPPNEPKPIDVEKLQTSLDRAGYAAVMFVLATKQLKDEQIEKVQPIIQLIGTAMENYDNENGLSGFADSLEPLAEKYLPGDENKAVRLLCTEIVKELLDRLDSKFDELGFKDKTDLSVACLKAFLAGADRAFEEYEE